MWNTECAQYNSLLPLKEGVTITHYLMPSSTVFGAFVSQFHSLGSRLSLAERLMVSCWANDLEQNVEG